MRYLSYDRVCSGDALKAANADFVDVSRTRTVVSTLPEAWHRLLDEQDSLLVDLLADKVESLCGFKPEPDTVAAFFSSLAQGPAIAVKSNAHVHREQSRHGTQARARSASRATSRPSPQVPPPPGPVASGQGFVLHGASVQTRSAKEVMVEVLRTLAKQDPTFLDRLAARPKHGRSRRYVARTREELYPDAPHLMDASEELFPGWWVGTNYNKGVIERILRMACEVARLRYGKDLLARL